MNRFARRVRATVTLTALALGALSATAPFAAASVTSSASKVPFTDPNIHGWLTLCNRNDQAVTSGSLLTTPFVWKAISSGPPPQHYGTSKGRATLYAYQPLKYVDPGDWTGYQLTGSSSFSNPRHPVAQATNPDQPLIGFTQMYPLHWDGLAEIRMMWSGVNESQLQFPYAAAIVRVTGTTWTLVKGGSASCRQGTGVSDETKALAKSKLSKPETATLGRKSSSKSSGSAKSAGGSAASAPSSGASGGVGSAKLAGADSSTGSTGMSAEAITGIALGAVALIAAAIGGVAWWRRRGEVG